MDLTAPFLLVTPTLDGPVLQALLTVEHLENGAEIHRRAGVGSAHGVRKVLRRLVNQSIAEEVDYSNAKYYRLNRQHIAYDAIIALASVRSVLAERLSARMTPWRGLVHASLMPFDAAQLIDVLVVAEDQASFDHPMWQYLQRELENDVTIWTGNQAHFLQLTRAAFGQRLEDRDPLLGQWRRTNTQLTGTTLIELMNWTYL